MRIKTLIVTVAVLAVLSAAAYWAGRAPAEAPADARVGKPLVDPEAVAKAARLILSDQGKTIELAREGDGAWRDTSYFDMPADFSKLSGFVTDLTSAKVGRLVTSNPTRFARLGFGDTQIKLLDDAGKPIWSVTLGRNADTGGRFVRFGNEPKAYLVNLNAWMDTDPKNWADAQLLHLKPEDIAKVEVPFDQGGSVTLMRAKKDDPWTADKTPAGQVVKADRIASLLESLGAVRFSDSADPADPQIADAKSHLRTFKLTAFDGKTYTVALGRKPEEKKPAATAGDAKAASGGAKPEDKDKKPEAAPEPETIPAGPVFVFITSSDAKAPVNALMDKRAFKAEDYVFNGLPQKADELFEPAPVAPAKPTK